MLSLDFIRNNKQKVMDAAKNKNRVIDIEKIISLDDKRRKHISEIQHLREVRNLLSKKNPDESVRAKGKGIKEKLNNL
ncbi:serine--tRNA ligase, partial [Candidatus Roizmanbacteria bacterium CG09_land_8_20_14_0_10_41_9]